MAFLNSVVGLHFFLLHFAFSKSKKYYVLPLCLQACVIAYMYLGETEKLYIFYV